jgi:hypothetical protein
MRVIYSKGVLGAARISVNYIKDEVKAATLKSCAGRPSASSGASLDFTLNSSRV